MAIARGFGREASRGGEGRFGFGNLFGNLGFMGGSGIVFNIISLIGPSPCHAALWKPLTLWKSLWISLGLRPLFPLAAEPYPKAVSSRYLA